MPWQAGQTGNPRGRPKKSREIQELAREDTLEAYNTIKKIMRRSDQKLALQAAQWIVERAWGKVKTAIEMTGKDGGPIEQVTVTDTEAARMIAFTLAKGLEGEAESKAVPEGETIQ